MLILDGSWLMYRNYYARISRPYINRHGDNVGALRGFVRDVVNLRREFPDPVAVAAWDSGGKTFRHEMYPEYKAERKPRPPELVRQFEMLGPEEPGWPHGPKWHHALGLNRVSRQGFEADDVIATLTSRTDKPCLIASADKDLLQLVSDRVRVWRGMAHQQVTREQVRREWGVSPQQVADVLALEGDVADGIPGVRGVGRKKAVMLIEEFGSVRELYHADLTCSGLPKRLAEALLADREDVMRWYLLIQLRRDVPMPVPEALPLDMEAVRRMVRERDLGLEWAT